MTWITDKWWSDQFIPEIVQILSATFSVEQREGRSLGSMFEEHPRLFPPMFSSMVVTGEESGRLEEVFAFLTGFYDSELDYMSKNTRSVLEPLLLIFIGVGVATVALSIVMPIYQITASFQF